MELAILLGEDATELAGVHNADLGACSLALTRGRFPKGYPHLDPNEDACLAATDGNAYLLAVADGHNGFDAARAAISQLADSAEEILSHGEPAAHAMSIASRAVTATVSDLEEPRRHSRTALLVAVITPTATELSSAGDCAAIITGKRGPKIVTKPAPFLATTDASPYMTGVDPQTPLLLATDGLIDFLGRDPLGTLAPILEFEDPRSIVDAAIEAAFAGASGDNIALIAAVP